jgi:hypothetical protein
MTRCNNTAHLRILKKFVHDHHRMHVKKENKVSNEEGQDANPVKDKVQEA